MKDALDGAAVRRIGTALAAAAPGFNRRGFERAAAGGLEALELKARVAHVIAALAGYLPSPFPAAAAVLRRVPGVWDGGAADDPLRGFAAWPLIDYVAAHGLDHPRVALELLPRLTSLFSAEFAVRPFFVAHYELAYAAALAWTRDEDAHVRRLASEGSRPRLPWGPRLQRFVQDPSPLVPLLDRLKDDPSDYVRRSVANNLNDISKDHPGVVVDVGARWLAAPTARRVWIVRHATRSLVKAGDAGALALLGYGARPRLRVTGVRVAPKRVRFDGAVEVAFDLVSAASQAERLVVDFAVHFVKASGARKVKVFKGRKLTLGPGEAATVAWRHAFREITTRAYYPGKHRVDVVVNGRVAGGADFVLAPR